MTPFNQPNPYGSYFQFNEPESVAAGSFLPSSGNLDPSVLTMMGAPVGGLNPTSQEYWAGRAQQKSQQEFMSYVMRSDPRASALSGLAARALFGGNQRKQRETINRFGGQQNFDELVGFALNQPGISGMFGGSMRSIGTGAMAISTSGVNYNGMQLNGYGALQDMAARQLFSKVTSQFYGSAGGERTSMTQGLNRDQIGGIMALGASQGAFGGMELGKLSMVNGKGQFNLDESAVRKISDFTKAAAKSLSGLIDIYGDASVGELMNKARQITGLDMSRLENMGAMQRRLGDLKRHGSITGIDTMSMFDTAAGSTLMAQRMGFGGPLGGLMGTNAAIMSAHNFKAMQSISGMHLAPISRQELAAGSTRDMAAMMQDPLGARRAALELMIQNGSVRGEDAALLRGHLNAATPASMAAAEQLVQQKTGGSLSSYIGAMGGPQGIAAQLNDASGQRVLDANLQDVARRQVPIIRGQAAVMFGGSNADSATALAGELNSSTLIALGNAIDQGASDEQLEAILKSQVDAGYISKSRVPALIQAARGLKPGMGGRSIAGGFRGLRQAMNNNPITRQHANLQDQRNALDNIGRRTIDDSDRGLMNRGITRNILDGMLGRLGDEDPTSRLAILAHHNGGAEIAGLDRGKTIRMRRMEHLNADGSVNAESVTQMVRTLKSEMSKSKMGPEGRDAMMALLGQEGFNSIDTKALTRQSAEDILERLSKPEEANRIFSKFQVVQGSDGRSYQILARRSRLDDMEYRRSGLVGKSFADALAGKLDDGDTRAGLLRQYTSQLQNQVWTDRNGDLPKGRLTRLSPEELQDQKAALGKLMLDNDLIKRLNVKDIENLADTDSKYGKDLLGHLEGRKLTLERLRETSDSVGDKEDARQELSDITKKINALKKKGVVGQSEDGMSTVMKLTGSMKLIGNSLTCMPDAAMKKCNRGAL